MRSVIGWVDFSSTDREKVQQVLAMLREKGTLDELGIGQIRDAYADLLFPGFSTILTRAKYLITTPRILRDYFELDSARQRKISLQNYLKDQESILVHKLVRRHVDKEVGIIGSTLVDSGQSVIRLPSSIYWNALRIFGLVNTGYSLAEFSRKMTMLSSRQRSPYSLMGEAASPTSAARLIHLDRHDRKWLEHISIRLTHSEAQFLADKLKQRDNLKDSVVAQLLLYDLTETALQKEFATFEAFSTWLCNQSRISEQCRNRMHLAASFSKAMEGAHIRFNILIAHRANNQDSLEKYKKYFEKWYQQVKDAQLFQTESGNEWLLGAAEGVRRFKPFTGSFIRAWADAMRYLDNPSKLDRLVENQAKSNKGRRSLLMRNLGDDPSWHGMDTLSYRWPQARIILQDILDGLSC